MKYIFMILFLVLLSLNCFAQLDGLDKQLLGPHLTLGYEHRANNYFTTGLAVPIMLSDNAIFRIKPSANFGNENLYGLALSWYPLYNERNINSESGSNDILMLFLTLSHVGARGLYSANDSYGIEAFYSFNLFLLSDIELGYTWLLTGTEQNFDKIFKIGLNINLSTGLFK